MGDLNENHKKFEDFFKSMEKNMDEIKTAITEDFIPQTEARLKSNVFVSIAVSLLIGLCCGIILSLFGKKRGKKR